MRKASGPGCEWIEVVAPTGAVTLLIRSRYSDASKRGMGPILVTAVPPLGSVRRDGRRVRINATLTDTLSGAKVWADRYDRDIASIFDLQDDVSRLIVSALALELTAGEALRFEQQQQIDPDAYDLLLRGLV